MMPKSKRPLVSTLFLICMLFVLSGVFRLGSGLDTAFASQQKQMSQKDSAEGVEPNDVQVDALLQTLLERERALEEKEQALAIREKEIALAREKVEAGLLALVQAEEDLAATLAIADGAEEADLARLTAVYENMKSKDAAPIFAQMAPEFAAGFLARMRPDAAAAIVSGLEPDVAYSISVILANRNRNAPKN